MTAETAPQAQYLPQEMFLRGSQLYFPEERTRAVLARLPYREHGTPDTGNDTDEIFPTGGDPAVLVIVDDEDDRLLAGLCLILPDT